MSDKETIQEMKHVLTEIELEVSNLDVDLCKVFNLATNLQALVSIDYAESNFKEGDLKGAAVYYCNALSQSRRYKKKILPKLKMIVQTMPELLATFPQSIINNWEDQITKV